MLGLAWYVNVVLDGLFSAANVDLVITRVQFFSLWQQNGLIFDKGKS